jgi:hypothetical protein
VVRRLRPGRGEDGGVTRRVDLLTAVGELHAAPNHDELLTRQQVADRLGVHVNTVGRQIAAGLPTVKFSPGTTRLRWSDVLRWIEAQTEGCDDHPMDDQRNAA